MERELNEFQIFGDLMLVVEWIIVQYINLMFGLEHLIWKSKD